MNHSIRTGTMIALASATLFAAACTKSKENPPADKPDKMEAKEAVKPATAPSPGVARGPCGAAREGGQGALRRRQRVQGQERMPLGEERVRRAERLQGTGLHRAHRRGVPVQGRHGARREVR